MQELYHQISSETVVHGSAHIERNPKTIRVHHGTVSYLLLTLLPSIPNNALPTTSSPTITTKIIANCQPAPLHMLVCGTASTGKSYLIRAIAHTLGNTCLLIATTGKASFNIGGRIVRSALKLPIHQSNKEDLQGSALQRLQLEMKGIHYIIIDEMSMTGHQILASDKQVANSMNQLVIFKYPLWRLWTTFTGGKGPLYAPPSSSDLSIHGHTVYNMLTTTVFLSQTLQQSGSIPAAESFRDFLSRLRDGTITHDDWQMLLTCTPQNAHQFTHAIRLFYTKERVAEDNLKNYTV